MPDRTASATTEVDVSGQTPNHPARHRDPASTAIAAGVGVVATIVGLLVLVWVVLFITKGRFLKPTFEKYASRAAGRPVRVAGDFQLYFAPIDVKFLAEGLSVANQPWASKRNFFDAKLIDTRLKTIPLIFGKRRVDWLELRDANIDAEWHPDGKRNTWTFGDPNAKGEPFQFPDIARAIVSGTNVRYRDPRMQLMLDARIDPIQASGNAAGANIANNVRFTGAGTLRAKPFTMWGQQTTPNQLLTGGRNRFELHARSGSDRLDLAGTLPGATQIEGSDLALRVRGRNLADLFALLGMTTPDTRAYGFRSALTKAGDEWRFTRLSGAFGNSDLAGRMTISVPDERPKLVATIESRSVDIVDIGPFIGYEPAALASKGATAAVKQTGGTPRILPDAPLRIEAIRNFDAHVDYKVRDIKQPFIPVSNIALTFDLDRSLMKLSPLSFDVAGGHLDSDISINARGKPVETAYDIRLSPTPMGRLLKGFGVDQAGTTGTIKARVQMTGEGDTLRESLASSDGRIAVILPRGTFWTSYTQLSEFDVGTFVQKMFEKKLKEPVQVNCGLIAFSVRNGVAAADPILIDTQKNVMTAKGGFSFRDESLDLGFRADAKKFSLFSGQSPVGIKGYFAAPSIQIISPELLARGGAGVAIGAAVNPLAAVLAFVDFGDAKAAACGPVLSGARASAQRTKDGEARKDVGTRTENREKAKGGEPKKEKKFLGIF
ncbi:AsmA family protein [Sphingomonas jatrophae]|uniref:AsmA domain-containing protein n=1 Tax=Sphingomonas jatrophae TaxID=1166337 RepID=A0A1I6LQ73_9SPHN|nr:AsmA family protein [Sphingomonas jatrophae]SFS05657.1 hypothetical protein SAMN05192580_3124 [Sphingomonas jatrophae]